MSHSKLTAGTEFPFLTVPKLGGGDLVLGKPSGTHDWQMIVVYRGKHCPICTRNLDQLNTLLPQFHALGVDVAVVSADPEEKAAAQLADINPAYPVGYDLSVEHMRALGLYISHPRSPEETDRPFAEPGLFVVNEAGNVQIVDISNVPFARPDLNSMVQGLGFIRNPENNYPIRGTHD